ncbi:MAG: DUF3617 domain-containing protein [Sphingobium sp.]
MRTMIPILAGAIVLLGGCGEKGADRPVDPSTGAQTVEEVAEKTRKVQLKPGQWEGTFTLESMDFADKPAGMPADMEERMKRMMNRTFRYCLTPEEAANPDGRAFSGQESKGCTYSGFQAGGGTVKGQVSCAMEGGRMTTAMSGRYSPDSYQMKMDMQQSGGPAGMATTMKAATSGKWIGKTCEE